MLAGDFVLNILAAEQKMTQVNIKYVIDVGTKLVNEAVNRKLKEALHLILENNLDPRSALSSLSDCQDKPIELTNKQVLIVIKSQVPKIPIFPSIIFSLVSISPRQ